MDHRVPWVRAIGVRFGEITGERAVAKLPDDATFHNHVGGSARGHDLRPWGDGVECRRNGRVRCGDGSGDAAVTVTSLLVATGRKPNTADVGLSCVGLEPGKPLTVDGDGRDRR